MTINLSRIGAGGLICAAVMLMVSCSKESVKPDSDAKAAYDPVFTKFEEVKEMSLPDVDPAKFSARSVRVKGDTLFVANNSSDDRAIYLFSIKENRQLGKISGWTRSGTAETFNAEIGDMAVSGKYIFVGMYNSRINIFERKSLKFVNAIGMSDGGYGNGIYQMVHCYGLREFGDMLAVRDKESIRVYWIYEAVTEPAFRVPWLGKVSPPKKVGYDYSPRQHGMVEYNGKMYLDDYYNKEVQVFDPSKMEVKELEESPIDCDAVYNVSATLTPVGLAASGGSLFISDAGTGKIFSYDLKSGTIAPFATFANRKVGRMELVGDDLYFIDVSTGKLVLAKGS